MHLRLDSRSKRKLERAAAYEQISVSRFVVSNAVAAAAFRAVSAEGLAALGRALGQALPGAIARRPRLVLGLDGELGAGKTTLAAAALRGLGVKTPVTSPTYGLVHPYSVQPPGVDQKFEVLHIDLYRLRQLSELDELGLPADPADPADFADSGGDGADGGRVLLVEWFANARGRLGAPDVSLVLRHSERERGRSVRAQGNSLAGQGIVQRLRKAVHPHLAVLDN